MKKALSLGWPVLSRKRLSYRESIQKLLGAALVGYWPLNEASGTVAYDISGHGYNGAYNGDITLGQPGIGDGHTCALFGGTNGYVQLAANLPFAAFPTTEGTLMCWAKIAQPEWIDGTYHWLVFFKTNTGKLYDISKYNSYTVRFASANQNEVVSNCYNLDWMHLAVTWSDAGSAVKYYLNGVLYKIEGAPGGSGAAFLHAKIGMHETSYYWKGHAAHIVLLNRPAAGTEILFASRSHSYKTITFIGDSITYADSAYDEMVTDLYNKGDVTQKAHAQSGGRIMVEMAAHVAAAATDNADIIIIEMGVNDDNAGNMAALQAQVEAHLATLKGTNPRATIYWMFLPAYNGSAEGSELSDKANIRTAVAAGCSAQGATYWDTLTTPWILPTDTSDGWHPTVSGHRKVAGEILARM